MPILESDNFFSGDLRKEALSFFDELVERRVSADLRIGHRQVSDTQKEWTFTIMATCSGSELIDVVDLAGKREHAVVKGIENGLAVTFG